MIDTDPTIAALRAAKHGVDLYNSHRRKKDNEPQLPKAQRKKQRQTDRRQSPTPKPKRQHNAPNILFFIVFTLVTIISLKHQFFGELSSQSDSKSESAEKPNYMTREEFLATLGTVQAEPQNVDYFPASMPNDEKKLRKDLERYDFSFTIQLELLIKAVLRIGDVPLYSACNKYWGTKKYLQCKSVLALKAKMFEIQHKWESVESIRAFIKGIEKAIKEGKL